MLSNGEGTIKESPKVTLGHGLVLHLLPGDLEEVDNILLEVGGRLLLAPAGLKDMY